jgi:hypothetical protein
MRDYGELVSRLRAESNLPYSALKDMRDAADAIEELLLENDALGRSLCECDDLLKKLERPKWISVEERLPEDKETCLIWYEYYHYSLERVLPEYGIGFYLSMYDMWYGDPSTGKDVKVLYWMQLPEPPKEDET